MKYIGTYVLHWIEVNICQYRSQRFIKELKHIHGQLKNMYKMCRIYSHNEFFNAKCNEQCQKENLMVILFLNASNTRKINLKKTVIKI